MAQGLSAERRGGCRAGRKDKEAMQGLDLSPVGLFLSAGLVGKAVMGALFARLAMVLGADRRRDRRSHSYAPRPAVRARGRRDPEVARRSPRRGRGGGAPAHSRRDGERGPCAHRRQHGARGARASHPRRGRLAQSRRHCLGRAVRRPVRHGLGHHVELRRDFAGERHEPRHGRAGHRRVARGDRLRARRGDPGLDRLQPHRRRLRPARPGDGVIRRGARDRLISRPAEVAREASQRRRSEAP